MIRLFLIFLITILLNATDFDIKFNNFDKKFANSSMLVKKKLHRDIKDIYIKTSLKQNNTEKKEALTRLIYSSKSLGYNYKGYENELRAMGGNYNSYLVLLKNNIPKKLPEQDMKEQITKPIKEDIKNSKISKPIVVQKNKKEEEQKNKKENSTIYSSRLNEDKKLMLFEVAKIDNGIKLKFNRKVKQNEIKTFALRGNIYRNVVDFQAVNYAKINKIEKHVVNEIRIAHFNKVTTRVVFTQNNKFKIYYTQDDNYIYITVGSMPKQGKELSATVENKIKIVQKPKLIVIDAGHGGKDPGAMANNIKEKDIALKISKNLGRELEQRGFKVAYTRSSDKFITLRDRTAFANKKNADLFVSIHMNAGPNNKKGKELSGVETFFLSPARSERSKNAAALENKGDLDEMNYFSKQAYLNFLNREKIIASNKLGIDIQKHMLNRVQKNYKMKDGGVREAPFWVLVGATMPAILIECGYVTNPHDSKMLAKTQYQKDIAKGIAEGIDVYFSKNR